MLIPYPPMLPTAGWNTERIPHEPEQILCARNVDLGVLDPFLLLPLTPWQKAAPCVGGELLGFHVPIHSPALRESEVRTLVGT